jgi:hypothetical protein
MALMGITRQQVRQMQVRLSSSRRTTMTVLGLQRSRGIFTMIRKQMTYLMMRPQRALALLGGLVFLAQADQVVANPVTFTLDSTNSVIALSGSVNIPLDGVVPFTEQSAGSLTTHYSGTVLLDLTPPAIQFAGGSSIVAQTNGTWQPAAGGAAGSASANYGGKLTILILGGIGGSGTGLAAGRNIKLDITSLPLTLTNSGFDAARLNVFFLTNIPPAPVLDYRVTGSVPNSAGGTPLTGALTNSQALAYLTNTAGLLKLVIPVNITRTSTFNSPNDMTMVLKGQLVATAPTSAWPLMVNIGVANDQVTLTWSSVTGQVFTVLGSPDLHNWSTNSGTTAVNGNTTTWTASQSGAVRFYRVRLQ